MSAIESELRSQVLDVLAKMGVTEPEETPNGFCFRLITSQLCIFVHQQTPDHAFVRLQGYVAGGVPLTDELCRYIALNGGDWLYGHLNAIPDDDGHVTVVMRQALPGDGLSDTVLRAVIGAVAGTLEQLDGQITAEFGGHTKYGDV